MLQPLIFLHSLNIKNEEALNLLSTIDVDYVQWCSKCWHVIDTWQGVLDTTLCDKVCQWLMAGRWFSLGSQVSSTNKTDRHYITEILLKGALNT